MSNPDTASRWSINVPNATSVYQVAQVIATHETSWELAAESAISDLAKTILDLRIARVVEKDVVLLDAGRRRFRVKLAVSYRIDRHRTLSDGTTTDVRRYLVVANETITGDALHRLITERITRGASEFHVVMPIRLQRFANAAIIGDPLSGYFSVEAIAQAEKDTTSLAQERLAVALERIRSAGAVATGEVASSDPLVAATTVLDRSSFDEIILSVLPRNISRWLGLDLHKRLARHTELPITIVEQPAS